MPDAEDHTRGTSGGDGGEGSLPKCYCTWKNCRSWQKTFRDCNHKVFHGVIRVEWNNTNNNDDNEDDENDETELKHLWDKLLKVDESKQSDSEYVVARHHFTRAFIMEMDIDRNNDWNWKTKCTKEEAERYYGEELVESAVALGDDGDTMYFKLPSVPKDEVKAMIKHVRANQKKKQDEEDANHRESPTSISINNGAFSEMAPPPAPPSSSRNGNSSMAPPMRRPGGAEDDNGGIRPGGGGVPTSPRRDRRPRGGGRSDNSNNAAGRSLSPPRSGATSLPPPRSTSSLAPPRRPGTGGPEDGGGRSLSPAPPMARRRITEGLVTISTQSVKDDIEKQERLKQIEEQAKQENNNSQTPTPQGRTRYGEDEDVPILPSRPAAMRGTVPLNENRMKRRVTSGLNVMNTLSVKEDKTKQEKVRQIEEETQQQQEAIPPPHSGDRNGSSSSGGGGGSHARFGDEIDNAPAFVPPPLVSRAARHGGQSVYVSNTDANNILEVDEEEMEELVQERDELQEANDQQTITIRELKRQIESLKDEIAEHVEREEDNNDDLEDMETKLDFAKQADKAKAELEQVMEKMNAKYRTLQEAKDESESALQSQLQEEKAKSTKLKEQMEKLSKEFREGKQKDFERIKDLEDEVSNLKKSNEMLTNKALQLSGKNAGSMLKIQELEDKLAVLEYGSMDRETTLKQVKEKERALQETLQKERERQAMVTAHMYFAKRSLKKMESEQQQQQQQNGLPAGRRRSSQNLRTSFITTEHQAADAKGSWGSLVGTIRGGHRNSIDDAAKQLLATTLPEERALEMKMA